MKEALTNYILGDNDDSKHTGLENQNYEYVVTMVGEPKHFCIGIIDIVNSTKTVANLPLHKSSLYYEIFLNTMAKIVTQFNAYILKTMGDSLLFYFPDTCYDDRKFGFLSCIECGFSLMNTHTILKHNLEAEGLPQIDFRISFDYGNVSIMKDAKGSIDLVGPTINTCAKINSLSPINEMIIGGDLYEKTKTFHEYQFKKAGDYSIDLKHSYPVYTVYRKN